MVLEGRLVLELQKVPTWDLPFTAPPLVKFNSLGLESVLHHMGRQRWTVTEAETAVSDKEAIKLTVETFEVSFF